MGNHANPTTDMSNSAIAPELGDDEFIAAFESCRVESGCWTHRAHVRMAWNYLRTCSFDQALGRIRDGLNRLNAKHGVPDALDRGYHETMTRAWLHIVAATMTKHGPADSSIAFCNAQPHLLIRTLLRLYYTQDRIMSAEAKARFVEPDIAPLPPIT